MHGRTWFGPELGVLDFSSMVELALVQTIAY